MSQTPQKPPKRWNSPNGQLIPGKVSFISIIQEGNILFHCPISFFVILNSMPQHMDSQSFLPKTHFSVILEIFNLGWVWDKLAPIYSKRHLQHVSMPFFPLVSPFFTTFLLGDVQKSKFCDLRLWVFRFFFDLFLSFLFLLFWSFCCSDWPFTGLASRWKASEKALSMRVIFAIE